MKKYFLLVIFVLMMADCAIVSAKEGQTCPSGTVPYVKKTTIEIDLGLVDGKVTTNEKSCRKMTDIEQKPKEQAQPPKQVTKKQEQPRKQVTKKQEQPRKQVSNRHNPRPTQSQRGQKRH